MTSSDMGIDKENLIVIKRPDVLGNQIESFKEQVLQIPGVEKAANATAVPGSFIQTMHLFSMTIRQKQLILLCRIR